MERIWDSGGDVAEVGGCWVMGCEEEEEKEKMGFV